MQAALSLGGADRLRAQAGPAPVTPTSKARATKAAEPVNAEAEAARRALVLVSYAGGAITLGDIEDAIAKKTPQQRRELAQPAGRERFVELVLQYDLLVAEAARRGYDKAPPVRDAMRGAAIKAMFTKDFQIDPASLPDAEIEQELLARKDEFSRPLVRRATLIQLATEAEAAALIKALHGADRLRFSEFARTRSIDARTQRQGGELGYFDRTGKSTSHGEPPIDAALVEATFALQREGEISAKPVPNAGGFGIVQLTAEMPAVVATRAKLDRRLREELAERKSSRGLDELAAKLRTERAPELHPELVDAIVLGPATPLDIPEGFPAAPPDPREPPRVVAPDEF